MQMTFGISGLKKTLTLDLEVPDTGHMRDTLDIVGDYSEPFSIWVTPTVVINSVDNSKDDIVTISFGHPEHPSPELLPLKVTDERGYIAMFTPRKA